MIGRRADRCSAIPPPEYADFLGSGSVNSCGLMRVGKASSRRESVEQASMRACEHAKERKSEKQNRRIASSISLEANFRKRMIRDE